VTLGVRSLYAGTTSGPEEGTVRPLTLDESLRKAHVGFTAFRHPAAFGAQKQAAVSHVSGKCWAKTVVCFGDEAVILAIVPAHLMVDLDTLRVLAGVATLRLASEAELPDLYPNCELGAISPFTTERAVRVFVDKSLVGEPQMVFSAGTHTDAIRMHYGDFAELTQPTVGSIGCAARRSTVQT
jgi:Ala-tRNA(Pro) deacylase